MREGGAAESIEVPTPAAQQLVLTAKACIDVGRAANAWRTGLMRYKRIVQRDAASANLSAQDKRATALIAALPSRHVPCVARLRELASALEEAARHAMQRHQGEH